ncbi:SRPBCC family protein [uncultured Aeromicrobium sp.]|uniref:SRPBCC family protein n=1 Tax=uncultured Aeromicrobium sp. TaxID=337820 RepID=UPI0025D93524|nr:SRPBCC family protein [uncultured Aeromicrobium sp.]
MTTITRTIKAAPEQIWAVLADGWLFPTWVAGAARMRDVEEAWPAEGSRIHHSVGVWPLLIDDATISTGCIPGRELRLRARIWPAGEAEIRLTLTPQGDETLVEMEEHLVAGPATLVPNVLSAPPLKWRNIETLRRLAFLAEGNAR